MKETVRWDVRMRTINGGRESKRQVEGPTPLSAGIALGRALERENTPDVVIMDVREVMPKGSETADEVVLEDFERAAHELQQRWHRYEESQRERLNHAFGLLSQGDGIEWTLESLAVKIGWAKTAVAEEKVKMTHQQCTT